MAGQSYKGPLDYIDVASRIVEFREKYPEGRLRQKSIEFVRDFAGKDWVLYTAEAWRSPDDPAPAHGTAWEPVPGPTQFTRDSEVQNAETAAWGRAMVAALAVDTRKGIASSEEVRNRQVKAQDKISAAVSAITECTDAVKLDAIEDHAKKLGIDGVAVVAKALTVKRSELGSSGADHWAPAGEDGASPNASPASSPAGLSEAEFEAAEAARFDAEAGAA